MGHQARQAHQGDVPTPGADAQNVFLCRYLRETLRVTEVSNAEAYCVVVSNDRPGGGAARTFREFVQDGTYYYPYGWGHGWPTTCRTSCAGSDRRCGWSRCRPG